LDRRTSPAATRSDLWRAQAIEAADLSKKKNAPGMPGSKNRSNSCNWAPNGTEFGTAGLEKIGEFRGAPIDPRARVACKLASRILGEAGNLKGHTATSSSPLPRLLVLCASLYSISPSLSCFLSFIFCYSSAFLDVMRVLYIAGFSFLCPISYLHLLAITFLIV
jgi:hypothetical protein